MNLVFVAVLIAACGAAKLDRTYLPPASATYAGGSPGALQTPFISAAISPGFLQVPFARISESVQVIQLPSGSYANDHQGIVVDAASPGTRASNEPSGLGGLRPTYGSTDSKVGEAAFRGTKNQAAVHSPSENGAVQAQYDSLNPHGQVDVDSLDLSAFHQPPASARPPIQLFSDRVSNTIKYHNNIGLNNFNYAFETENGIKMEGNGVSVDGVKAQGGYSYTGDDGKLYSIVYTADKDGYRPQGSHLPTPPPIPVEILQSLEQNAKDEAVGLSDDGSYDAQKYNVDDDYTKSDANGEYNDRQSNEFGERPGSEAGTSGTFINQHKQVFVQPNIHRPFGTFDSSKDKPGSTNFGIGVSGFDNVANKGNGLSQNGQNNQLNNRFESQTQYLPPVGNTQGSFGRPSTAFIKPSSYDTSITGQVLLNNISPPSSPHSFGINSNISSAIVQTFNDKPLQDRNPQNDYTSIQFGQPSLIGSQPSLNANSNTEDSSHNYGDDSLSLPLDSNLEIKPYQGNVNNKPVPQFSTNFSQTSNSGELDKNQDVHMSSFSSQEDVLPTKQPDLTLTTPLDDQNQSIITDSKFPSQISIQTGVEGGAPQSPTISTFSDVFTVLGSPTKKPNSVNFAVLQSNTQKPNYSQLNDRFTGQIQDNGNSYIYNKPLKPFNTPNRPDSSNLSVVPSSQFNGVTQASISPFPSIEPTLSSTLKQQNSQFNIPNLSVISQGRPTAELGTTQTFSTKSNNENYDMQSQFGQDSLVKDKPQDSNKKLQTQLYNGEIYQYNKPEQGSLDSSQKENTAESNSKINDQSLSPLSQKEDIKKVNDKLIFGQRNSIPHKTSTTLLGQSVTPSRFGVPTSSLFGQQTTPSPYRVQASSAFGQPTIPSHFGIQAGSSFGQHTTPSPFGVQTGTVFGEPIAPSRFGVQTSSSFGQHTTPSPFNVQTGSIFGQQIPSRFGVQTSSSFGQQTTPSPFGVQTGSAFRKPTTPSRFGIQFSSSFGQKTTPSPFGGQTDSLFGKPIVPSRFGVQTSSTFGQNILPSRFGVQTSSSFGQKTTPSPFEIQQTTPSRFGAQASSIFGHQPTLISQTNPPVSHQTIPSQFSTQSSPSIGQQTTPSRFSIQSSSSVEQPTIPSRFGLQSSSTVGQQTTSSQFDVPSSSSFEQKTTTSPFNAPISSLSGQQTTSSRFDDQTNLSFGQKITSQFDAEPNKQSGQQSAFPIENQQNQFFEFNKQSESPDNLKPSTLLPITSISQNLQDFTHFTAPSDISDNNRLSTSTSFSSNKDYDAQTISTFGQPSITQSDKKFSDTKPLQFITKPDKSFSTQTGSPSSQKEFTAIPNLQSQEGNRGGLQHLSSQNQDGMRTGERVQQSHVSYEPTKQLSQQAYVPPSGQVDAVQSNQQAQLAIQPDTHSRFSEHQTGSSSTFASPQPTTLDFVAQTNTQKQSFDNKESPASQFSQTALAQNRPSTSLPSSPSFFNSQKQDDSQLGEVYQYNKPSQLLPDHDHKEKDNTLGHEEHQLQFTGQPDAVKFDMTKPITSLLSQSPDSQNLNIGVDLQKQNTETTPQTTLTQSTLSGLKPFGSRPQFSFQSACCRGFTTQNRQGSSSKPVPNDGFGTLNGKVGDNGLGNNRNDYQGSIGSGVLESKFGYDNQGSTGIPDFGAQKETFLSFGKGEEFGGPRKPPSFDGTGYHY